MVQTAPDASKLRIHKQYKNSAYSQQSGLISHIVWIDPIKIFMVFQQIPILCKESFQLKGQRKRFLEIILKQVTIYVTMLLKMSMFIYSKDMIKAKLHKKYLLLSGWMCQVKTIFMLKQQDST